MCTSARKRKDRLDNLTHELPAYSSSIQVEDPRADTVQLSANAWGCENPHVRPACRPLCPKGWGPTWCGIGALGELVTRASRDDKRNSDTICHGTRGFKPVRHSRIPYYESKPSGSSTISTGFALPWACQENGSSSQPVCVGFRLNPSSRLSPRLATSSPNSTRSACLNSKESRAIVFPTRTPLKHVSNNLHNHHRH
ncbi:hypothetical protein CUMW_235430 [Citrus unshiu]|uniref:Uncharacterized protein n=1 Tax=Citrus unshiu TaxID=55188 RepID=A0A2H5QJD0_CITUN|nr:hypothetical protein CUMW_235430 [Citrus unshiu]